MIDDDDVIGLEDLAPIERLVELTGTGKKLRVRPLGAGEIAVLFMSFPQILQLASKKEGESIDAAVLLSIGQSAPDAIPAIIAMSQGKRTKKAIDLARRITATDQLKLVTAIIDISMPGGADAFLAAVEELFGSEQAGSSSTETAFKVPDMVIDGDQVELRA